MDIFEAIHLAKHSGKPSILAMVVESKGSAPRRAGARMLIKCDGSTEGTVGGGAVEKRVLEEAEKLLRSGGTTLLHYDLGEDLGMSCGGKMTIFLETLVPIDQLIVFGAGHIGRALVSLCKMLDFHISIIDNRPDFANKERLPSADTIIVKDYDQALKGLDFSDTTFIVIVTHRHLHDQEIIEYCIRQPFAYLGMIGSKKKVQSSIAQLREKAIDEGLINRIHAPIGLDIGAESPEEIAISIAAELVAVRSGVDTSFMMKHMHKLKFISKKVGDGFSKGPKEI